MITITLNRAHKVFETKTRTNSLLRNQYQSEVFLSNLLLCNEQVFRSNSLLCEKERLDNDKFLNVMYFLCMISIDRKTCYLTYYFRIRLLIIIRSDFNQLLIYVMEQSKIKHLIQLKRFKWLYVKLCFNSLIHKLGFAVPSNDPLNQLVHLTAWKPHIQCYNRGIAQLLRHVFLY